MGNYFTANIPDSNDFYTWVPDTPDTNDEYRRYKLTVLSSNLKKIVDNVHHCGPVLSQGELGSCTANAIAGAYTYRYNLEYNLDASSENEFLPSRLFIYYNERNAEGTPKTDSGAQIRDGITSIRKNGVCPESMWPYDITKFTDMPSTACYDEAIACHKSVKQHRVIKTLESLRGCLDTGRVFVFGFTVFESFKDQSKWNGYIMPSPQEGEKILGGHAVLCIGYDDFKKCFKVRNSWGAEWGDNGNFYMPYDFMIGSFNTTNYNLGTTYWSKLAQSNTNHSDTDSKGPTNTQNTIQPLCSDIWTIDLTFDKA